MRIKKIDLAWFRGAADLVSLETSGKSLVIYGENGSGKSSFVDAIEFAISDGKIGHLAHEYSGKNQERGVLNTHAAKDKLTCIAIGFSDDSTLAIDIAKNGAHTSKGSASEAIRDWDYRQVVLRQDEVAAFISSTKGSKYSALLPLFGLESLELAAENMRQLAKATENVGDVKQRRTAIQAAVTKAKAILGADFDLEAALKTLHHKHCPGEGELKGALAKCKRLRESIEAKVEALSGDQKRHLSLTALAELDVAGTIEDLKKSLSNLAAVAEDFIEEKLAVLKESAAFAEQIGDAPEIDCPACGRVISSESLRAHIEAEQARLEHAVSEFEKYKQQLSSLGDQVVTMKSTLGRKELSGWKTAKAAEGMEPALSHLAGLDPVELRRECSAGDLAKIESLLLPLLAAAKGDSASAPPEAKELAGDLRMVETAEQFVEAGAKAILVDEAEYVIGFLKDVEVSLRDEIRKRSEQTMKEISVDVQRMWAILHPDHEIAEVRLYQPADADKAIDIELQFHGVELNSPRLTLSEGNRNSLGLCIFLAMAKRAAKLDRPVFLDDVVVSLDRNHRGMVAEVLEKEFADRQVVLFTHDRDWYIELRTQLDGKTWDFRALLPYGEPGKGIRWSSKTGTFADARAQLTKAPDTAGNIARKIMDTELSVASGRLKIKLEYRPGFKNDHRMAHEFLERLATDGKVAFSIKDNGSYRSYSEALDAIRDADKLLMSWGNKASHTFDVAKNEAAKLIDACEKAIEFFICPECKKGVYRLDDGKGDLQCACGILRWRYGKL